MDGGRLKSKKSKGRTLLEYEYNKDGKVSNIKDAGNRIKRIKDGIEEKYTYNNRNQFYKKEAGKEITDYVYDLQGNLIYEKDKKGITQYKYNDFNQTKKIIKPDGSFQRNFYDPEGLRSSIIENNVRSNFVFDRENIITESDGEDNIKASYTRGLGLISQINKSRVFYYLNNNHDDVTGLSDIAGNVVNSYKYDAFGNIISNEENIPNRFRYSGEQYDQVTNQYYLRSRFYNPVIARFTQEDTYRGDGLNLYEYVHNNPVKYIDPSGNESLNKNNAYGENRQLALPAPEKRLMLPEPEKRLMLPEGVSNSNLDQKTIDKILPIPKGERPNPSTYLSREYIKKHLAQFDNGASIIMTKEQYINYVKGNSYIGIPDDGTQFVLPKSVCDNIEMEANRNITYYEKSLGFDIGHFEDGGGLVRIDINDVSDINLRIPSGNEAGTNSHWLPGGYTDGGIPEAISDLIPNVDSKINIIELK